MSVETLFQSSLPKLGPVFHPVLLADSRGHEEVVADDLAALPKHGELGVVATNGLGDVHLYVVARFKVWEFDTEV